MAASLKGIEVNHRLQIDGKPVPVESITVNLMLNDVGNALFTLPQAAPARKGSFAEFFISVAGGAHYLVFTGAVTEVQLSEGKQHLRVRELCAVLEYPTYFFLRRASVRDVILKIEEECRLHFILPSGARYLDEIKRPTFESKGSCKFALSQIPKMWDLPDAVWYQMPDGTVFWGKWHAGPFTKAAVPIESKLMLEKDSDKRLVLLPSLPALRPGMIVQSDFRFRIDAVTFQADTVLVNYTRL